MPIAKQADSGGGEVVFDISCTSVTAGTNTAFLAAIDITSWRLDVALGRFRKIAAEMTRNEIAVMDNQLPVFIEGSSREFNIGPPERAIL